MFKNILIILLAGTTLYFAWIAVTMDIDPVNKIYERYNHMRIYEDGSYEGEDRNGVPVDGCLKKGLCQD